MIQIDKPKISIITPAFNAARFLADTFHSIVAQTRHDWEWIVVDDASTDDTAQVVISMSRIDPRVRLLRSPTKGVSSARNFGVANALGEYIALLDADDSWKPTKLEKHLIHLDANPQIGVSFSTVIFASEDGTLTNARSKLVSLNVKARSLLFGNPTTTCSTLMIRRAIFSEVGGFDQTLSHAEDLDWLLRVACQSPWRIVGIDEPLTIYRTSPNGLSAQAERMQAGWEALIDKAQLYAPKLVREHATLARASHLLYLARRCIRVKESGEKGHHYLTRAFKADWRIPFLQPFRTAKIIGLIALFQARDKLATARKTSKQPLY